MFRCQPCSGRSRFATAGPVLSFSWSCVLALPVCGWWYTFFLFLVTTFQGCNLVIFFCSINRTSHRLVRVVKKNDGVSSSFFFYALWSIRWEIFHKIGKLNDGWKKTGNHTYYIFIIVEIIFSHIRKKITFWHHFKFVKWLFYYCDIVKWLFLVVC